MRLPAVAKPYPRHCPAFTRLKPKLNCPSHAIFPAYKIYLYDVIVNVNTSIGFSYRICQYSDAPVILLTYKILYPRELLKPQHLVFFVLAALPPVIKVSE